ncbi:Crp/Fnr family transcriptional regulator [Scleromatobacter humisilvae]|uniref:Crp/Fnr family transcriptional regulator n=1 Tax=Scleromatobacter humisilvae TaxID=2897159 RepID=A0A9X2BZI8_9BURK|nr:Crp/Fnr family transcriptional regulator [Scleromatobacter humisilvae]MCK9685426.1 Crp/Fnr family transcriptional regulator [Scleromatobacter humisilvae]
MIAAAFSLVSFTRRGMLPLRAFAIGSNVFFVAYAVMDAVWPVAILHGCLLPLNIVRLVDIRRLTAEIRKAQSVSEIAPRLLPHMTRVRHAAGELLFRKGDAADSMIYVASGRLRIDGLPIELGPGDLIGEIGLFTPERKRTQTLVCETDCELYRMTDEMLFQLFHQDPSLGFYFMRLVVGRLQRDIENATVQRATDARAA